VAKRQKAWTLQGGKWIEADVTDALHKGRVVAAEYFGVVPEPPEL
jgi:hypothetical protein